MRSAGSDPAGALPKWALIRRDLQSNAIADVTEAVADAWASVADRIRPGQRICLAVGSRGIDRIDEVVRALVGCARAAGARPFVVPAMGSHGGATADGQRRVLASLGITEDTVGCEVRSSVRTVTLGSLGPDLPVHIDAIAIREADAIIPVNRVKLHTDFQGPVQSGILKMIAIGLGNRRGADTFHRNGFDRFDSLIPAVGAYVIDHAPIPFAVALLEDARAQLSHIETIPSETIVEREPALLRIASGQMARLPVDRLDVLIIDRIGKDVSGLGMDSNVVGRYYTGPTGSPPLVQRIVVRDLTDGTAGNAVGIGLADVVLRAAVDRMDAMRTYMNCITAKTPEGARVALTVEDDRAALDVALACCVRTQAPSARLMRIVDTKHLERLFASESVLPEILATGNWAVERDLAPIRFDSTGGFADGWSDP